MPQHIERYAVCTDSGDYGQVYTAPADPYAPLARSRAPAELCQADPQVYISGPEGQHDAEDASVTDNEKA